MKPLVGLGLGGPSFTPRSQSTTSARLGEPTWGAGGLLRDLELRLALTCAVAPRTARVARYAARIAEAADGLAFYAKSFASDAQGTADVLLAWRDTLIEAGWDGLPVSGAGPRLEAIARLEAGNDPVPPGDADRLVSVLSTLSAERVRVYEQVVLAEAPSCWPGLWRTIFDRLASEGTSFTTLEPELPGAPIDSDLGRLQELLRRAPVAADDDGDALSPCEVRGDGSLVVLRGETLTELAALTAALLASDPSAPLVVRSADAAPLEAALLAHGLAQQGLASSSSWRPAMQILPLTLELAFEPRDPRRALELLTLSVGPFRGSLGRRLAKAISRSPGIGGREWETRKADARDALHARELLRGLEGGASEADARRSADSYVAERMQLVTDWLEVPGVDPRAARATVFAEIVARVQHWLHDRIAVAPDVYGPALVQAKQLAELLGQDPREQLSREAVRQLVDAVVRAPHDHERSIEGAGRTPHVPHPSAILAPCGTLCFWGFTTDAERRPAALPWNAVERDALAAAGVRLLDRSRLLVEESAAWRRGVLAARERVVLVIPGTIGSAASAPHALWDEISARLRLDGPASARLTRHARELRTGPNPLVDVAALAQLPLPDSAGTWRVDLDVVGAIDGDTASVTSLETLATCPLRWVLEERAELASGAVAKIASDSLLCGNLGHRLVEELFVRGAFDLDERAYALDAEQILDRLVRTEAAMLLMPGMSFERAQLVPQLLRAARGLHRYLDSSGFRIAAVEDAIELDSPVGRLRGRLDVRLLDALGGVAVLDLKWGEARYRGVVKEGRAIQLAAYAQALPRTATGALAPAGYFALRSGRVVASDPRMRAVRSLDGASLAVTWDRVARTADAVVASLRSGEIPVSGVRRSLPLLDALSIPSEDHGQHYAARSDGACSYCSCSALCGRAWEGLR